jgi:hypothetical protein
MNIITKREPAQAGPDPADFAKMPPAEQELTRDLDEPRLDNHNVDVSAEGRELAPLFLADVANEFRSRWSAVQSGFVDDPREAVRQGDELVAQVIKSLKETFSKKRATLDGQLDQADKATTETLRSALRRYRSFFERLLAF